MCASLRARACVFVCLCVCVSFCLSVCLSACRRSLCGLARGLCALMSTAVHGVLVGSYTVDLRAGISLKKKSSIDACIPPHPLVHSTGVRRRCSLEAPCLHSSKAVTAVQHPIASSGRAPLPAPRVPRSRRAGAGTPRKRWLQDAEERSLTGHRNRQRGDRAERLTRGRQIQREGCRT